MKRIVVKESDEVPTEVLAESIKAMSDGVRALRRGRLNDRALLLLIQHAAPVIGASGRARSRVGVAEVKAVLDGMESLEHTYLKKERRA